jgi:hypothetical protein
MVSTYISAPTRSMRNGCVLPSSRCGRRRSSAIFRSDSASDVSSRIQRVHQISWGISPPIGGHSSVCKELYA